MKTVWKFPLTFTDNPQTLAVPGYVRPVYFEMQDNVPTVWVECAPDQPSTSATFRVFGTGHRIPDLAVHVGSCKYGLYIWHLYELKEETH